MCGLGISVWRARDRLAPTRFHLNLKNGLVRLKDHSIAHLIVLVQVQPRAVRTRLPIDAVRQHPRILTWFVFDA